MMKGYLSYTLAAVAMVYGILGLLTGLVDADIAMNAFWAGAALFGLRRAI